MAWSEAAKERAEARRFMMLDEIIDALKETLFERECVKEGNVISKPILIPMLAVRIEKRRRREGYMYVPSVENTPVKLPDAKTIKNNWSRAVFRAADVHKIFIVWEGGKRGGVRLGTVEEYNDQQSTMKGITEGVKDMHNRRADVINREMGEGTAGHIGLILPDHGGGDEEDET